MNKNAMRARQAVHGMTVCYVKWLDAARRGGNFTLAEVETKNLDRIVLHTAGMLVKRGAATLTIAESFDPSDGTYRDLIHIPNDMIEDVKLFSLSNFSRRNARGKARAKRSK